MQRGADNLKKLEGLAELAASPEATTRETIIQIGAALEACGSELAARDPVAGDVVQAALELLQAVYQDQAPDAEGAMAILAGALGDLQRFAEGTCTADPLTDAGRQLRSVLQAPTDDSEPQDPPAGLEDLAGRLLSLAPDASDELRSIGQRLNSLATGDGEQAARAARAVGMLREVINSQADDPADCLARAAACLAGEDAPEAEPEPAPQGEPAAAAEAEAPPATETTQDPPQAPAEPAPLPEAKLPDDTDVELLREFMVESLDHINAGEASLLALETNAEDSEQINTVFRAFHTIKGTSAFLGLDAIQKCAHLAENLLDRARDGEITINGGYADLALRSCDALRTMIESLEGVQPGEPILVPDDLGDLLGQLENPEAFIDGDDDDCDDDLRVGDILVARDQVSRQDVEQTVETNAGKKVGEALVQSKKAKAADVAKALRTQKQARGQGGEASIRVSTDRLDNLINMVGELVIAHSMVSQDPDVCGGARPRLARSVSHSGKIIRELQDLSMSLRMVPLKSTFQKMARLVRDLARKNGKNVQFVTEGEDTEIDRNMVESLNDPLVHMVRNAVDHGVEASEDRVAAGKGEIGTVKLRAYHSAGNVVIELADDGKGLDRDRIVKKAVERNLIEPGKDLSDSEVFAMIFHPGFSTAAKVTDVSGRGVGMDVVKRNIESLRGRIEVSSQQGQGSTFSVRLPLTMAITDAMLLRVGPDNYLLPTVAIEQSFRPAEGSISTVVGRGEVVQLRGELMPMFRMHNLFEVDDAEQDPYNALLIVIEGNGRRCALMVDELLGQQQVVIKSLGQTLQNIPGVAGGAILGDGRVGLILDAAGLIKLSHGDDGEEALAA